MMITDHSTYRFRQFTAFKTICTYPITICLTLPNYRL